MSILQTERQIDLVKKLNKNNNMLKIVKLLQTLFIRKEENIDFDKVIYEMNLPLREHLF